MRCSIVINNYNYGRFLEQCVESALAQTVDAEVIVVDDGSTDESKEVIERFRGKVEAVYQANAGQGSSINAGVARATGDVIALLDADDWFFPHKVDVVLEAFAENPELDWLRHDFALADADGKRFGESLYSLPRTVSATSEFARYGDTIGATSCLAFRREFFVSRVGAVPLIYTGYADTYIRCGAALNGPSIDIPEALAVRRYHSSQISKGEGVTAEGVKTRILYKDLCASRAAEIGRETGDTELADADTWWQRRAHLHSACLRDPVSARLSGWARYVRSLRRSRLSPTAKVAFAVREGCLALTPRRWFTSLWWWSNDGRPMLRGASPIVRSG